MQGMPKICQKYAQDIPNICQRYLVRLVGQLKQYHAMVESRDLVINQIDDQISKTLITDWLSLQQRCYDYYTCSAKNSISDKNEIYSMFCVVHFFQTIRRLWWYVCIAICEFLIWQFHWMHLRSSLQYSIAALVYSDALFDWGNMKAARMIQFVNWN